MSRILSSRRTWGIGDTLWVLAAMMVGELIWWLAH